MLVITVNVRTGRFRNIWNSEMYMYYRLHSKIFVFRIRHLKMLSFHCRVALVTVAFEQSFHKRATAAPSTRFVAVDRRNELSHRSDDAGTPKGDKRPLFDPRWRHQSFAAFKLWKSVSEGWASRCGKTMSYRVLRAACSLLIAVWFVKTWIFVPSSFVKLCASSSFG